MIRKSRPSSSGASNTSSLWGFPAKKQKSPSKAMADTGFSPSSPYTLPITPCRQDHTMVSCQPANSPAAFFACFIS